MKLGALTAEQVELVRQWRNQDLRYWRTPYFLTEYMQIDFYHDVVCNRDSKHRYFGIYDTNNATVKEHDIGRFEWNYKFIGMGGLTNIEWENSTAEISLVIDPEIGMGGEMSFEAALLIRRYGHDNMGLETITGEAYECGYADFWNHFTYLCEGYKTKLIKRKRWNGKLYDSVWFSV